MKVTLRMRLVAPLLLCGACTLPIGAPARTGGPAPASLPTSSTATQALARAVIAEANRARESRGAGRLQESPELNRAAREHSEELASRSTLDHNSIDPARHTMTMRIEAAGGTWLRAAENLASVSGGEARVPTQAVRMWLESDGHRANLLEPAYTHTGVGVAVNRHGIWYVTQLYVVPRPGR